MDKDQLVADFQACTGIEDAGLALKYLEDSSWNLINAVNDAMSREDTQYLNTSHNHLSSHNLNEIEEFGTNILNFHINYNHENSLIRISDSKTIGNLKEYVSEKFKLPVSQIVLTGWLSNLKFYDFTILSCLSLPLDNYLNLNVNTVQSHDGPNNDVYMFKITNCSNSTSYTLQITGEETFADLKSKLTDMSKIPLEHQLLIGCSSDIILNDQMKINTCGFDKIQNIQLYDTTMFNDNKNQITKSPTEMKAQNNILTKGKVAENENPNRLLRIDASKAASTSSISNYLKSDISDLSTNPFSALKHSNDNNNSNKPITKKQLPGKKRDDILGSGSSRGGSSGSGEELGTRKLLGKKNYSKNEKFRHEQKQQRWRPTVNSTKEITTSSFNTAADKTTSAVTATSASAVATTSSASGNKTYDGEIVITSTDEEGDEDDDIVLDDEDDMHFTACNSSFPPTTSTYSSNQTPLIPPNTTDYFTGHSHFLQQFEIRYGKSHPIFSMGTMQEALDASCNLPILDRKLLAMYLHNDKSILSNIFCTLNLCSEAIVNYLDSNFVVWPWDLTDETNCDTFLQLANNKFGKTLETTLKRTLVNEYPVIVIIQKIRGQYDILNIFKGNACMNDLMTSLIHSVEMFRHYQESSLQEEMERDARERMKRDQDEAYRLSLEVDKAKKLAKEREFEQDQIIQKMKEEEDEFKLKEKEAIRMSLVDTLPPEPAKDSKSSVTTIKIRIVPQNRSVQRRFLADDKLGTLLNFIASLGFDKKDYCYLTHWPTADISTLNPEDTLRTHKLYPQVSLTITERTDSNLI